MIRLAINDDNFFFLCFYFIFKGAQLDGNVCRVVS